MTTLEAQNFSN